MFTIAINASDFTRMEEESKDEIIVNAAKQPVVKGKILRGTWITPILKKINEFEGKDYSMIGKLIN
jgi:hypothetical protein